MPTSATASKVAADPVVTALNKLLAQSYALMGQAHLAHWNVEGPDFYQLHAAFQKDYEALFEEVDEIAERVRALNAYAEGGLDRLSRLSDLTPMPVGRQAAKDYVAQLIDGHEKVCAVAKEVESLSGAANDLETQDLAIGVRKAHQKTVWMLNSYLK